MLPLSHKHPRTSACPQANVLVPPTTPWPLLPAHSAITPNSVSHFPRALSDKFIKLRDGTVSGHIKKRIRKKKEKGEQAGEPSITLQGHISTLPRSCGQAGRGILILHHLWFLSEPPLWAQVAAPSCLFSRRLLGKKMAGLIMPEKSQHPRPLTVLRSNQL